MSFHGDVALKSAPFLIGRTKKPPVLSSTRLLYHILCKKKRRFLTLFVKHLKNSVISCIIKEKKQERQDHIHHEGLEINMGGGACALPRAFALLV